MHPELSCFKIFVRNRGSFQGFPVLHSTDGAVILLHFMKEMIKTEV